MVLSNPDQLDVFEQEPKEEEMVTQVEPDPQLDAIAENMRRMAKEKRMTHVKALDIILEDMRIQTGMSPKEIADLKERFAEYDLKVMIQRSQESAERKSRAREGEHSHEEFLPPSPAPRKPIDPTHEPREGWMAKWEREREQ